MDGKKQVKEEATVSEATQGKSNGDVKVELMDFQVIDELGGNKGADGKAIENNIETKVETKETSGESDTKTAAVASNTSKKNDSNELNAQDNEKNGDSLILTADEDLEAVAPSPKKIKLDNTIIETDESKQDSKESAMPTSANTEASDKSKDSAEKVSTTKNQRVVWVSNISKTIKATDLKQYLSKSGKIITTKIVTDGKRCFGYVLLENANDASECIKTLNNTTFEGHKITLSFSKPSKATHAAKTSSDSKKPTKSSSHSKRESDTKPAEKSRSTGKHSTEKNKVDADSKTKKESPSDSNAAKSTDKKVSSRSQSRDRYAQERSDRDRLKRRILLEERKNREARQRQIEMDERQREKEFRLEQERRKLQMEREFFEKQKREWSRINEERRKLERVRIEVEHQRAKLEEDLKKDRLKRKSPDMIPSIVISKLSDPKKGSKISKRDDYKNLYDCPAPPPPKLGADFDHGRKVSDRKLERVGGRKIEVIDRKFYGDSTDRKKHYNRKPEFEESKPYMKRYPGDREDEHRTQWSPPIGFGSTIGSSAPRYQDSIPSQVFGGGATRASGYYYHPTTAPTQEFTPRYEQLSSRKY